LIDTATYGSSVNIEGRGWFIFAGHENDLEKSQHLTSLNSTWKDGPALLDKYSCCQCVVQAINLLILSFRTCYLFLLINSSAKMLLHSSEDLESIFMIGQNQSKSIISVFAFYKGSNFTF